MRLILKAPFIASEEKATSRASSSRLKESFFQRSLYNVTAETKASHLQLSFLAAHATHEIDAVACA